MKVTYYLEVVSSWCYWAEPAWAELRSRYAGRAEFSWKIALMDATGFPVSREQCDWFYRRSGTVVASPFALSSGWFDPKVIEYLAPNLTAEAARDFGVTDDRVRLAIAHAGLREGRRIGDWETCASVAAAAVPDLLDAPKLLERAKSADIEARARAATGEFHALGVTMRPTFALENTIGDRAVFSGLAKSAPLIAAMDALLADEAAQLSYAAHHGGPPSK